TPSPHSFNGAKGMGEGGAAPIHTLSAALQDALFDQGIIIDDSFNNGQRVCIIGCGAIGSLYAAHLARVAEVYAFVRRREHAEALNRHGLRVTSTSPAHNFTAKLQASANARELPEFDLGIVACKATQTEEAFAPVGQLFDKGAVISAQNGLGSEEIIAAHTRGWVIRGTTFMSGTRHSDTHVQYV